MSRFGVGHADIAALFGVYGQLRESCSVMSLCCCRCAARAFLRTETDICCKMAFLSTFVPAKHG